MTPDPVNAMRVFQMTKSSQCATNGGPVDCAPTIAYSPDGTKVFLALATHPGDLEARVTMLRLEHGPASWAILSLDAYTRTWAADEVPDDAEDIELGERLANGDMGVKDALVVSVVEPTAVSIAICDYAYDDHGQPVFSDTWTTDGYESPDLAAWPVTLLMEAVR